MGNTNDRRRRQRLAKRESISFLDRFAFLRAGVVLSVATEAGLYCGGAGVEAGAACAVNGAESADLALSMGSLGLDGIAVDWARLTC